jgi:hypothetical protein
MASIFSRLLQGIPRQAYKDKKRLLAKMEEEAGIKQKVAREKRVTKKYHKVRFVDKQKVSRRLARVEKKLGAARLAEITVRVWPIAHLGAAVCMCPVCACACTLRACVPWEGVCPVGMRSE